MNEKQVRLYSKVTVKGKDLVGTFMIVEPEELDVSDKKISFNSPLGKALLGRKVNENIMAETPKGMVKFKIVAIG